MTPYYQKEGIEIWHGDCRDLLPWLAKRERARLVLADPPYGAKEETNRNEKGRSNIMASRDWAPVAGDDEPFDPAPILALQRPTILWGGNYYADKLPPSRCWFVWDKRDGVTSDDNADCELAWTNLDKPARLFAHLWKGCITASEKFKKLHPTQKPVALMRWCLTRARVEPGSLILDPYMGSGPVALACKAMELRYVGIELVGDYCEVAAQRLNDEFLPALLDTGASLDALPLFAQEG